MRRHRRLYAQSVFFFFFQIRARIKPRERDGNRFIARHRRERLSPAAESTSWNGKDSARYSETAITIASACVYSRLSRLIAIRLFSPLPPLLFLRSTILPALARARENSCAVNTSGKWILDFSVAPPKTRLLRKSRDPRRYIVNLVYGRLYFVLIVSRNSSMTH